MNASAQMTKCSLADCSSYTFGTILSLNQQDTKFLPMDMINAEVIPVLPPNIQPTNTGSVIAIIRAMVANPFIAYIRGTSPGNKKTFTTTTTVVIKVLLVSII